MAIFGTETHDEIYGTDGADDIFTYDGHDFIWSYGGDDYIDSGAGHDVINAGDGDDIIFAGSGYDISDGGNGSDTYLVGLENLGFVDTYNDTGTSGTDRLLAIEAYTVIGLITGFGPDSGIELIGANGYENVTIGGTDDPQVWDLTGVTLEDIFSIDGYGGNDEILANDQDNRVDGGAGQDVVYGAGGADELHGGEGHDILHGDDGNDVLTGGAGYDLVYGGAGDDALYASAGGDALVGGDGNDTYYFSTASNGSVHQIVDGGTEADSDAEAGSFLGWWIDLLFGSGPGEATSSDRIAATENNVAIGLATGFNFEASGIEVIDAAGFENVTISGSDAAEEWDFTDIDLIGVASINAGAGNDIVTGSAANNVIDGGAGFDVLQGADGNDEMFGGAGHDILHGDNGNDALFGGEGYDMVYGGDGEDSLFASVGHDTLDGGEDSDTYYFSAAQNGTVHTVVDSGKNDKDRIEATEDGTVIGLATDFSEDSSGIEVIDAMGFDNVTIGGSDEAEIWDFSAYDLGGIESISSGAGNDVIIGTRDGDSIFAGDDQDVLFGERGNDLLDGGAGHDILYGGRGDDVLNGGAGHDMIYGDGGDDILTGGAGYDTFVFDKSSEDDTITDFTVGEDMLFLKGFKEKYIDIQETNDGLVIDLGRTDILLQGLTMDDFTWDMVAFG